MYLLVAKMLAELPEKLWLSKASVVHGGGGRGSGSYSDAMGIVLFQEVSELSGASSERGQRAKQASHKLVY